MTEYKFVKGEKRVETVVKRSRFIATAFGEADEDAAAAFIERMRKTFPDATHNCYAYIADETGNIARFSDDGEPQGTAGQPILQVLKKSGLKKTALCVTRYFGGIKLGASGLMAAYAQAAANCIEAAQTAVKYPAKELEIVCDYARFAAIEGTIRGGDCVSVGVDYGDTVTARVLVKDGAKKAFTDKILQKTAGAAKIKEGEFIYAEFQA